jgi:hypothetical protein
MSLKEQIQKHCYKNNGQINGRCNNIDWWKNKQLLELYYDILNHTSFLDKNTPMVVRFYHIINDLYSLPICQNKECNNPVKWHKSINGYAKYCSQKCNSLDNKKLGKNNNFSNPKIKEKIKQTNIEKYGKENYAKTEQFSERMKLYHKNLSSFEKQNIQHKREQTNFKKYNTSTPLLNSEIKEKIKSSLLERYGVDSPLKSELIRNKILSTNNNRYNRDYYNQQHLDAEILLNLSDKSWVETMLNKFSTKELAKKCNISYSTLCRYIRNHDIDLNNYSYLEQECKSFIETIYKNPIIQKDTSVLEGKEIDIYLPDIKLGIELNGLYWHGENKGKHKTYHLEKSKLALSKGIRLIHIFEDEWNCKQDVVKNRLRVILNDVIRIPARKCIVKKVSLEEEKKFTSENHLQGYTPSKLCYGLYYQEELISLMSFCKPRFNKKVDWELARFCNLNNILIIGGTEKLFKHFLSEIDPKSVISYCDLRWFSGKTYEKLGFVNTHNSLPNYYYIENDGSRSSRQKYQKHKLKTKLQYFDPKLTEWENMKANGYDRVWDCGNSVWLWQKY